MKEPLLESTRFKTAMVTILVIVVSYLLPLEQYGVDDETLTTIVDRVLAAVIVWIGARTWRSGKA